MSLRTEYPSGAAASSSAARFRERELANRRRPWRRAFAVLVAVTVVAVLVWVLGWSSILGVSKVEVSGATGAEASAVAELVDVPIGTPLARVDTDAAAARVRERITGAEVSVRRAWPSTLAVDIVLRTPAIVVRNPQGQLEVVDAEGVSFGVVKAAPKGVPVVKAVGAKGATREALQSALALLNALPSDLSSQVSGITVSSANLVTFTLGKRTVVWGSGADSERKVAILTALLPTKAKVIDVSAPETPVTR
ncbi:MAG TPA: cell division protein FtsQ/DivIB [Ornithinibacter sp.]|nr:cell division protein FtsQ/DivIB [Ornithinibacter sp.]HQA13935.1 cell division protein FtsQ/DivIB [Ornithinibacter sp.]HQD67562.1 cell division protein FtsQ/DivIB [Ornithinibacter sp.]